MPPSVSTSALPAEESVDLGDHGRRGGSSSKKSPLRRAGLILGPCLFVVVLLLPIPGLDISARGIVGLAVWMATWWFSEAIPLAATSLLPLVVYPLLGRAELQHVGLRYADDAVLLFLGTLLLARGISRSGKT